VGPAPKEVKRADATTGTCPLRCRSSGRSRWNPGPWQPVRGEVAPVCRSEWARRLRNRTAFLPDGIC